MRSISRRDVLTRVLPGLSAAAAMGAVASPAASFVHGVASGDPTQDAMVLWTRVTPRFAEPTEVTWELSPDPEFAQVDRAGAIITSADRDFTVKVDVTGLPPASSYFYRFSALGAVSATGRTRTLPTGPVSRFTIAACSCSNYPAGYFNAYQDLAGRDDVDIVLHLGDYLYEYPRSGYASEDAEALRRESLPGHETVSLEDYRQRHAQYKTDPDLQQVHARFPFVVTWDDHELTNDAWHGGAQNHSEDEGSWNQRKMWAVRAYYEWMPIREPAVADQQWRALEIGDLATLIMLETRLSARDRQPSLGDAPLKTVALDLSNPDQPRLAQDGTSAAATRVVDLPFDVSQSPPVPLTDPAQILALSREEELPPGLDYLPDVDRLEAELLNDPARQLLGETQRSFIRQQLEESAKQNKTWQIIGNQTLLTPVTAPDVSNAYSEEEFAALPSYVSEFIPWTSQGIPLGTDSWNGYGAERSWFLGEAAKNGSNIVVLTGDTHAAWGMNLEGPGSWQGIELGTTSISSPGFPQSFSLPADAIESRLKAANPQLRYSEVTHRGYLTLTLTADDARVTFHRVSDVKTRQFDVDRNHRFVLTPGSGNGVRWS